MPLIMLIKNVCKIIEDSKQNSYMVLIFFNVNLNYDFYRRFIKCGNVNIQKVINIIHSNFTLSSFLNSESFEAIDLLSH